MNRYLALAMGALLASPVSAFTLHFNGYPGAAVLPKLNVHVPGYGDVEFAAGFSSELRVGPIDKGSSAASLQFRSGESVHITFLGTQPAGVDFDFAGLSAGEAFRVLQTGPRSYFLMLQGSGDGAGLRTASFDAAWRTSVPEPGTALLALLGFLGAVIRRRC